jgi:hypothetical protein
MRRFNLSGKLEKIIKWLEEMRSRVFFTMEEYPSFLQSNRLEFPLKSQQFVLGLSQQSHKLSEEVKKVTEHIHIMIPKSIKSNPSLQRFLDRNSRELKLRRLSTINDSTKLASDELYAKRDTKFGVYLSTGLHQTLGTDSKSYFQLNQMEAFETRVTMIKIFRHC